ncbi:unnamed protein product [Clonostachys rosea]|uniref:Fungal-type protein kinase domain-containing protein n=1 Tax=Bionectria ochroleuca TaxID=29856 RepID=A0ABY6U9F1_BIOOC|nr:unnamed protein product [Clonostachys rosea]
MSLVDDQLPLSIYARVSGELNGPNACPFLSTAEVARLLAAGGLKEQYTQLGGCTSQPSFFLPRSKWPKADESKLTSRANLSSEEVIEEIGPVSPMRPWKDPIWQENQGLSRAPTWKEHMTDVRNGLVEIQEEKPLSQATMNSLLTIMAYGLEGVVSKLPAPLRVSMTTKIFDYTPEFYSSDPADFTYLPGTELVRGEHTGGLPYPNVAWFNMAGRRLLVGAIEFYEGNNNKGINWATIIFDRQTATLYYIDTSTSGRDERFKAACCSVKAFWTHQGYPYAFNAYCLNLPPQDKLASSGVLSLFTLWIMIRGLVGSDLRSLDLTQVLPVDATLCDNTLRLPIATWHYWSDTEVSIRQARGMLTAICCNELGIRKTKILRRTGRPRDLHGAAQFQYDKFGNSGFVYTDFTDLGGFLPIDILQVKRRLPNWIRIFEAPLTEPKNRTREPCAWKPAKPTLSPDQLPPPQHWFRCPCADGIHSAMMPWPAYIPQQRVWY